MRRRFEADEWLPTISCDISLIVSEISHVTVHRFVCVAADAKHLKIRVTVVVLLAVTVMHVKKPGI